MTETPRPDLRLGAVAIDCADPAALADFYRDLTGWPIAFSSEDFVALGRTAMPRNPEEMAALGDSAIWLTIHRVPDHRPPSWPDGGVPKQIHLDFATGDLDAAEAYAVVLGARKASLQPSPKAWRVLIDPAGHPFCISANFPES